MDSQNHVKTITHLQSEFGTLKVRFLILLLNLDRSDATITHMAKILSVFKSTVSRMVDWFEEKNMVKRSMDRKILLTTIGKDIAMEFEHRREVLKKWILNQGMDQTTAEEDSINIIFKVSSQFIENIEKSVKFSDMRKKYSDYTTMSGDEFCKILGDGSYEITFIIYKFDPDRSKGPVLSMANEGLEKKGELRIKNGKGLVFLRSKPLEHVSRLGGLVLSGKLNKLKYQENNKFKDSAREGDTFYFPASILNFINIDNNRILQGSAILRMLSSVGPLHMPESSCIFTVYF